MNIDAAFQCGFIRERVAVPARGKPECARLNHARCADLVVCVADGEHRYRAEVLFGVNFKLTVRQFLHLPFESRLSVFGQCRDEGLALLECLGVVGAMPDFRDRLFRFMGLHQKLGSQRDCHGEKAGEQGKPTFMPVVRQEKPDNRDDCRQIKVE